MNTALGLVSDSPDQTFTAPVHGSNFNAFSNPDLARRYAFDISLVPVPEPAAGVLLGLGLGVVGWLRRLKSLGG